MGHCKISRRFVDPSSLHTAVQAALVPLLALLLAPAAPAPLLDGGAAGLAGLGAAGLLAASPLLSPLAVGGAAGVGFSLPTGV